MEARRFILTPYGRRCALDAAARQAEGLRLSDQDGALVNLLAGQLPEAEALVGALVRQGQAETAASVGDDSRNDPLRHVRRVIFEYTTGCNLACGHCFNGPAPEATESRPGALVEAGRTFCRMGIREFDFVGGEVPFFGRGWLGVARGLHEAGAGSISVVTNGTWAGLGRPFVAAGRRYGCERDFLDDLHAHGVTDVVFSLDGEAEAHDRSRGVPGLHDRIVEAIPRVREAGLGARVSLVMRPDVGPGGSLDWIADLGIRMYGPVPEPVDAVALAVLVLHDRRNSVSHVILACLSKFFDNGPG